MARVRAHPRSMGPKIDSLLSPAQPLRLALVDPIGRYLRVWKSVDQLRVLSRFFFFLLLPLLTAAFSTIIAKRKVVAKRKITAEGLEARAESNDKIYQGASLERICQTLGKERMNLGDNDIELLDYRGDRNARLLYICYCSLPPAEWVTHFRLWSC
jgi:hypothetical protein